MHCLEGEKKTFCPRQKMDRRPWLHCVQRDQMQMRDHPSQWSRNPVRVKTTGGLVRYQQSDLPYIEKLEKVFETVDETYANTMWTLANSVLCGLVGKMDQPCFSGSPPETVRLQ